MSCNLAGLSFCFRTGFSIWSMCISFLTGLYRTTLLQQPLRSVAGSPQTGIACIGAVCERALSSNFRPACQKTCRYFPLIFSYSYYLGLLHFKPSFSGRKLLFRCIKDFGKGFLCGRNRPRCKVGQFRFFH